MSKRTPASDVIDGLLTLVAVAGTIGISIAAPNSLVALEKPLEKLLKGKKESREAARIAKYLKQRKLVEITGNEDGSYTITLSEKGKSRAKRVQFERLEIPDVEWDNKWRVVSFDIPEQHKTIRDYISKHLRMVGFKQLQRSVFVYPYPVEEFIVLLKDLFPEIEQNLTYMLVEDIDQHNTLVKQFKSIL